MRSWSICVSISLVFCILVTGCKNQNGKNLEAPAVKLRKHHSLKLDKNLLLGLPIKLKVDHKTSHLFILDAAQRKIIELDDSNKIVNIYGRKGRGPGEILRLDNFFISRQYLFTVDGAQRFINKYSLQDGHYISSLNYGQLLLKTPPARALYMDNNNQPFVTRNGTILLPSQTGGKYFYEVFNWEGEKLGHIGTVPKGYKSIESDDVYWSALAKNEIPASDLAEAFPVNDCLNLGSIYLIDPAKLTIAKYSLSGRKLWEHKITQTPEVDSLIDIAAIRARGIMNHPGGTRIAHVPIRTYIAGRCGPKGDLYLTTYTFPAFYKKYRQPLWIHQFSPGGRLLKRFRIVSDNIDIYFFPAIDFQRHRIFVSFFDSPDVTVYSY